MSISNGSSMPDPNNPRFVSASPLYKIELQAKRTKTAPAVRSQQPIYRPFDDNESINSYGRSDRDSIISFESVSTTGRLLDRLGFEDDDYDDYDRRSSVGSNKTLLRHLSNASRNSSIDNGPMRMVQATSLSDLPISPNMLKVDKSAAEMVTSMGTKVNQVKKPVIVNQNGVAMDEFTTRIEMEDVNFENSDDDTDQEIEPRNSIDEFDFGENSVSRSLSSTKTDQLASWQTKLGNSGSLRRQAPLSRTPSAPILSLNKRRMNNQLSSPSLSSGTERRIRSESVNSQNTLTRETTRETQSVVTADSRVQLAIKLRAAGKQREASYQLGIASNQGHRQAMLLYGLAIRYGYGVKKDDRASFVWLCRSVQMDLETVMRFQFEIDPFDLAAETESVPRRASEPEASSFFELGMAFVNGWGVDRDQVHGLKFIEMAASLGNVDAMCEAATLWSNKGPHRKKDSFRSAAWFRLAESRGIKSIGNSWIYKEKYMKRK